MKIIAFAASNSRSSINKQLVHYAGDTLAGLAPSVEITYLDLNDFEMPIFSVDREAADGIPEPAQRFFEAIGAADAVLISFAEHNGSYAVAYKNVFDWASRIDAKVFQGKSVVALSTSPGPRGGQGVLGAFLGGAPHFGAEVLASLSVGRFQQRFDVAGGSATDPELANEIRKTVAVLVSE